MSFDDEEKSYKVKPIDGVIELTDLLVSICETCELMACHFFCV